jgi:hypothetical protein
MIAKHWAKTKQSSEVKKDKGSPGVYHELIQTWVTYELTKVIYIFGLNPQPHENLHEFAPDIYTYIYYLDGNDDEEYFEEATRTHTLLIKETQHSSVFTKCLFTKTETPIWDNDVKPILPLVILTWLRQLEEFFTKHPEETWSTFGDYLGNEKYDKKNPLGNVVLTNENGTTHRVTQYTHIKPYELYKSPRKSVCLSLEEWAMCLLNPDIPSKLEEAIQSDIETQKRWTKSKK